MPQGSQTAEDLTFRGGIPGDLRSANRGGDVTDGRDNYSGFRVARTLR